MIFFSVETGFASIDYTEFGNESIAAAALTSVNYFLITNNSPHLAWWPDKHQGMKIQSSGLSTTKIFLALHIPFVLIVIFYWNSAIVLVFPHY